MTHGALGMLMYSRTPPLSLSYPQPLERLPGVPVANRIICAAIPADGLLHEDAIEGDGSLQRAASDGMPAQSHRLSHVPRHALAMPVAVRQTLLTRGVAGRRQRLPNLRRLGLIAP